ncbi:dipeptidase [Alkalicoccobacillus murimartini]|uniref:Membrane dipeptidase n=1 Tax=Alkalicoccobacillus murimartini TaxID=171685 RepID=A0ABT9YEE1_9BACI|nr:dipeptidase [Alkalicoccobacillus murimartini]MDQ0206210.1 membrane dipeptidase [Alkalicoccobacillus murimartini]
MVQKSTQIQVIDTHCDVLLKLWMNPQQSFLDSQALDVNLQRLQSGGVKVQCFALFVEPFIKQELKFQAVLEQIRLFHQKIIRPFPQVKHIKKWEELASLKEGEIGAILTLEGMDAVGADEEKHLILIEQGVLSVGLTWNEANHCADGVLESRGAGITDFGRQTIRRHNEHKLLTDVSHLSETSFWDTIEVADYAIASHSNSTSICPHPRNLNDAQAQALFKQNRYMGMVFFPKFLTETEQQEATITDVLRHMEYLCSIGGEKSIGFGSDFDGISDHVVGLEHAGCYSNFIDELAKHYSDEQIRDFCSGNFLRSIPQ